MSGYRITAQKQITKPSVAGGFEQCMEVRFLTTSGVPGMVCVPLEQYNPQTVAEMIQRRVDDIDAVNSLGS